MRPLTTSILRPRVLWYAALLYFLAINILGFLKWSDNRDQPWIWGWDNNHYFAWGRSLVVDRDLDFRNDFAFVADWRGGGETQAEFARARENNWYAGPHGYIPNKYGFGCGLLSVPFLLAARGCAAIYELSTGNQVSPFAAIYPLAFIATSILAGFTGLAICFRLLSRLFNERIALFTTITGTLGTSLGYYIALEPTMSHSIAFFAASGVVALSTRLQDPQAHKLTPLWVGLVLGFACTVRYTSIALAAIPVAYLVLPHKREDLFGYRVGATMLLVAGTFIGFLPQITAWMQVYGIFATNTYKGEIMHPWPKHALLTLFSARHGLITWTPIAGVGIVGLVMLAFQKALPHEEVDRGADNADFAHSTDGGSSESDSPGRSPLALGGVVTLLIYLWIYGSWDAYWLGNSFGMRGFVDASPLILLGLAAIAMRASQGRRSIPGVIKLTAFLLILWNIHLATCFSAQLQPRSESLKLTNVLFTHPDKWQAWGKQFSKDFNIFRYVGKRQFDVFSISQ